MTSLPPSLLPASSPSDVLHTPDDGDIRALAQQLHERLLALRFHAFAHCITHLLERLGYIDVQLAGRTDWKGRNQHGGFDLAAVLPVGIARRRVIVSLKQFDRDTRIYQRAVDELRGACLRTGASEALLITTAAFSPSVRAEMLQNSPVAPVRLIDGDALLALLVANQVGLQADLGTSAGKATRWRLDEEFFAALSRESLGNGRSDCGTGPRFLVTVSVEPVRGRGRKGVR